MIGADLGLAPQAIEFRFIQANSSKVSLPASSRL